MAVHIAPLVLHIRGYADGVDVEQPLHAMSDPYLYHLVVLINDRGIARIQGLDGTVSLRDFRQLANKLKIYGVQRMEWRHHGIEKHYKQR